MREIIFYKNNNGESDVENYMAYLEQDKSKYNKKLLNKIIQYISQISTSIIFSEPIVKYIKDNVYELRPYNIRIFFSVLNNKIVILHYYIKQSNKMPKKEIKIAIQRLSKYMKGV